MTRDLYCRTTESLVLPNRTKFYPTKIPVPHYQLRHFISTAEQDYIYYANRHDIYALNLRSNQRSLVATLPFEARCVAADHGWICIGGEVNGDCAFILIERDPPAEGSQNEDDTGPPKCFGHRLIIKELGREIVNAMKIQKLYHVDDPQRYDMVVLISNNDKTLKIYSLDAQRVLTTLEHPVSVNYACLSPDSRTLVAVGDANNVYFYRRSSKLAGGPADSQPSFYQEYDWSLIGAPDLPVYESTLDDFSFSVVFSPCGRLCAVSSQGGTISVFDMESVDKITDTETLENAIICAFKSSRQPSFGCVRSMAFSPEPWGLLAWAEDHGRVGIADVRQCFVRRQIMKLDKSASDVVKVETKDITPSRYRSISVKERLKQQHLTRLRVEHRSDTIERDEDEMATNAWAEESRSRQDRRDLLLYHHGLELDARERSVLEALETTMDDIQQTITPPAEENYSQIRSGDGSSQMNSADLRQPSSSESDGDELSGRPQRISREQIDARDDGTGGPRSGRAFLPRRRASVVLSSTSATLEPPNNDTRHRLTASPSRITRTDNDHAGSDSIYVSDDLPPLMSTNDLTPNRSSSSQPHPYNIPPSEPVIVQESGMPQTPSSRRTLSSLSPSRYSRRERSGSDRRYEGDPEFEADLEAHLTALSARYGAAAGASSASGEASGLPTAHATSRVIRNRQEETRRRQMAHIESLERQVRRTENRVAIASSEIEVLESAIVNGVNGDRHARILEARAHNRARAAANAASNAVTGPRIGPTTSAILRDLERLRNSNVPPPHQSRTEARAEAGRRAEQLGLQSVSENDMRLARHLIMSGARSAMDRNGNWVAAARDAEAAQPVQPARPTGAAVTNLIEEALREMGPGTAGVGWSPDGRFLYAGTEEGLFEYAVNLRDRMQFPSCDMR